MKTQYMNVYGERVEYYDTGPEERRDAMLFLHGNPSSCYSWRKVIPPLSRLARCVAPSLVGFGGSSKPEIPYSFANHAHYLEKFIETLGLERLTLVIQDWGSALGFDYAMRHENRIDGVVFFEAILRPYESWDVFPKKGPDPSRDLFKKFRTGDLAPGGVGWGLIVDQNVFVGPPVHSDFKEALLDHLLAVPLPPDEKAHYTRPFERPESRFPVLRFTNEIPIEGHPADVTTAVGRYSARLGRSELPFLLLYSKTGATLVEEHVQWCRGHFKHLTVHQLERPGGSHYFQESHPEELVRTVENWWCKR